MDFKWLAGAILAIIVMIFLIIGPSNIFDKIKATAKETTKYVSFGADKELGVKPTIPEEHRKAIDKLVATMEQMRDSGEKNCIANYGRMPDLGEKGTGLEFKYDSKTDTTGLTILGGKEGVQEVDHQELKGIKLCVIAGEDQNQQLIAGNFYSQFLDPSSLGSRGEYYLSVDSAKIFYDSGSFTDAGNRIIVSEDQISKTDNFEDDGYLFTPDGKKICFFPTLSGASCEGEYRGLQNNCFADDPSGGITVAKALSRGDLKSCRAHNGFRFIEATIFNDKSDVGVITTQCPIGEDCSTYEDQCNSFGNSEAGRTIVKEHVGEGGTTVPERDFGENCLLVLQENEKCGYVGMTQGTKIGNSNNPANRKLFLVDEYNAGGSLDFNKIFDPPFFVGFAQQGNYLQCDADGNWTIHDIPENTPKGTFPAEGHYSRDCEDGRDNNGNGLVDCDDPVCYGYSLCVGKEHKELDGKVITAAATIIPQIKLDEIASSHIIGAPIDELDLTVNLPNGYIFDSESPYLKLNPITVTTASGSVKTVSEQLEFLADKFTTDDQNMKLGFPFTFTDLGTYTITGRLNYKYDSIDPNQVLTVKDFPVQWKVTVN